MCFGEYSQILSFRFPPFFLKVEEHHLNLAPQTHMIHPDTEIRFISKEIGYGVVATKLIPKGTITWVLDALDREFTPSQIARLDSVFQDILYTYTFRNNVGNFVLCWDHGRYVNHSFKSNCMSTAYDFEIAIRDIHPGEQLTDDYGYLNVTEPFFALDEGTDRKAVYPDDILTFGGDWDALLSKEFRYIIEVEQKMKHLLSSAMWDKVEAIARGKRPLDSIASCHFEQNKTTSNA